NLLVRLEMLGQLTDSFRQQRHLYLGGAGVLFVSLVLGHERGFALRFNCHVFSRPPPRNPAQPIHGGVQTGLKLCNRSFIGSQSRTVKQGLGGKTAAAPSRARVPPRAPRGGGPPGPTQSPPRTRSALRALPAAHPPRRRESPACLIARR